MNQLVISNVNNSDCSNVIVTFDSSLNDKLQSDCCFMANGVSSDNYNLFDMMKSDCKNVLDYTAFCHCVWQFFDLSKNDRYKHVDPFHLHVYASLFLSVFVYVSLCDDVTDKSFRSMLQLLRSFDKTSLSSLNSNIDDNDDCGSFAALCTFYKDVEGHFDRNNFDVWYYGHKTFALWLCDSLESKWNSIQELIAEFSMFEADKFCSSSFDVKDLINSKKDLVIVLDDTSYWNLFVSMFLSKLCSDRLWYFYYNRGEALDNHVNLYLPTDFSDIIDIELVISMHDKVNMNVIFYDDIVEKV